MNKFLAINQQDVVDVISELMEDNSIEEIESLLGIQFAYKNNPQVFAADFLTNFEEDDPYDGERIDFKVWRHADPNNPILPSNYPAIVVYWIESGADRLGKYEIRAIKFVTMDDFVTSNKESPQIRVIPKSITLSNKGTCFILKQTSNYPLTCLHLSVFSLEDAKTVSSMFNDLAELEVDSSKNTIEIRIYSISCSCLEYLRELITNNGFLLTNEIIEEAKEISNFNSYAKD